MKIDPTVVSLAALTVSVISAGSSIFFNSRERARLTTKSVLYPGDDEQEPSITISAVNVGRRPLILRMWVGTDKAGKWVGTHLGDSTDGKRLGENERVQVRLTNVDLGWTHDEVIEFSELWFEDTVGRRYRVKQSRKHIEEFWKLWRAFNDKAEEQRRVERLIETRVRARLEGAQGGSE